MRVRFRCDPALLGILPPPIQARDALPGWISSMPSHAISDLHAGVQIRTVKHCPPFVDAMTHGFMMTLPCDVTVKAGVLSWDWAIPTPHTATHPRAPLSFHSAAQISGTPFQRDDQLVVKFNSFWTIQLDPGWSLFVSHPANRDDLPFRLLSGLIDCDRFYEVGILFPAIWHDISFEGVLPRGMPVAQCIPVPRETLELELSAFDTADQISYDATAQTLSQETGYYRRLCRAPRSERFSTSVQQPTQSGGIEDDQAKPS